MNKIEFINSILEKNKFKVIKEHLVNNEDVDIIYKIFTKDIKEDINSSLYNHYMGVYNICEKNIPEAKKYYLKSIEQGNLCSLCNYEPYVEEKEYPEIKKYYLIAIEKGNIDCIGSYINLLEKENKASNVPEIKNLYLKLIGYKNSSEDQSFGSSVLKKWIYRYGDFMYSCSKKECHLNKKWFEYLSEAKKYTLLTIEDVDAMGNYGCMLIDEGLYTNSIEKIEEGKKYLLMAIEKGDVDSMHNYALQMEREGTSRISEAKKYYLMAIEKGDKDSMLNYARIMKNEYKIDSDISKRVESIKYFYKYFEKTRDLRATNEIRNLFFNEQEQIETVGELTVKVKELESQVKDLQNFKNAVNEIGPMNALVLGYI